MSVLVLDCGTSALKAVLFADGGEIVEQVERAYAVGGVPHRQSPDAWWQAAVDAVLHLAPQDVAAVVLTGTMENLIVVGADGAPVTDAILYSDPCGAPFLEHRAAALRAADAARIAGNAPEPLMTAFKLGWLAEAEPNSFAAARHFLPGSKDFLALRLTGVAATDAATAATTGLMDLTARTWSDPLLMAHGIALDRLPAILAADAIVGPLTEEAATVLGLARGIPVINGSGDGAATTVGSGAEQADDVSLYLGSSGWVARVVAPGDLAPRPFYRLPHPLGENIIEIAPILSAGAAAQWARTALGLDIAEAEALAVAADGAPGTALFLPYLNGERSPFTDLDLRAGFVGVAASDGPGQLYYAVLEGVAFAIAANLEAMGGAPRGKVSLIGGGALSKVWPQIIADVVGADIIVPENPVAAASLGAFRIAARALGLPASGGGKSAVFKPRRERRERAEKMSAQFQAATDFLRGLNRGT